MWVRIVVCSKFSRRKEFESKLRGNLSQAVRDGGWVPWSEHDEPLCDECKPEASDDA